MLQGKAQSRLGLSKQVKSRIPSGPWSQEEATETKRLCNTKPHFLPDFTWTLHDSDFSFSFIFVKLGLIKGPFEIYRKALLEKWSSCTFRWRFVENQVVVLLRATHRKLAQVKKDSLIACSSSSFAATCSSLLTSSADSPACLCENGGGKKQQHLALNDRQQKNLCDIYV